MQTHDSVAFQPGMNIFTDKGHQNSWNQSNISMLMKKKDIPWSVCPTQQAPQT